MIIPQYMAAEGVPEHGNGPKTYRGRFKNPAISIQPLVAHRAEIQGDHIVMFDSDGRLVALFWMAIVESWSEIPHLEAAC